MAGSSDSYHEPLDKLSSTTQDMHRALVSLQEELEAVDWYQQRAEACSDPDLAAVLQHNRDEEIEHGMMTLEWLRRRVPAFDENMRRYLFTEGPIVDIEAGESADGGAAKAGGQPPSLGIGKLDLRHDD
jgi:ferritin-like protein